MKIEKPNKLIVLKRDSKGRPYRYQYGEYEIQKSGTKAYPYNVYKGNIHVGYDRTLKDVIYCIDNDIYSS